jgi:hypothetical protein
MINSNIISAEYSYDSDDLMSVPSDLSSVRSSGSGSHSTVPIEPQDSISGQLQSQNPLDTSESIEHISEEVQSASVAVGSIVEPFAAAKKVNVDSNSPEREFCDLCISPTPSVIACEECLVRLCQSHKTCHLIDRSTYSHKLLATESLEVDSKTKLDEKRRFTKVAQSCQDHELVSLDELDSDIVIALDNSHLSEKHGKMCELHKLYLADKYCVECSEVCCAECAYVPKHSEHKSKIGLLKDHQPEIVQEFKIKLLPETTAKLETLIKMSAQIDVWSRNLDKTHKKEMDHLAKVHKAMELQYNRQKLFLESTYENTKKSIIEKKETVEARIKLSEGTVEEIKSSLINSDVYDLPLKKSGYIKAIEEIADPSMADITTSSTVGFPIQYPMLKKKERSKDVHYFTEYENIILANPNPFRSVDIDLATQIITLKFEFEQSDFNDLGFEFQIPELTFEFSMTCGKPGTDCEKNGPNCKFIYDQKDFVIQGRNLTIKGKDFKDCKHKSEWVRKRDDGGHILLFFWIKAKKYEIKIPYDRWFI